MSAVGRAGRKVESGLGAKMRTARLARGLGLRDLAVQVGMSPSSLSEFETGKSVPGPARLEALARALGVAHPAPIEGVRTAEFRHWRQFEPVRLGPVRSAALELFVELGYHGATVRMIAERCNMTVAGVYLHVSRKDELLTDLLEQTTEEVLARLRAAGAEAGEDPERRLANLVECMVLFHIYRLPLGFLASSELRSLDDDHRERIRDGRAEMREIIRDAVASCRRSQASAVADETTARAIATMCVGVMDWWDAAGRPDPAVVAADFAVLALAMVRATPAELVAR